MKKPETKAQRCRRLCHRSDGWNDAKRMECRATTPCSYVDSRSTAYKSVKCVPAKKARKA